MPESSYIPSHSASSTAPKQATLPVPNPSASFWLSDLDPVLKGHRTTTELPEYSETVIVGSGITGASAAWKLASKSKEGQQHTSTHSSILVLEAREACSGATGRNGGHLQPLLLKTTTEIAAFELKNCKTVAELIKEHSIECEYRAVRACRSFWIESRCRDAEAAVAKLKKDAPELADHVEWIHYTADYEKAQLSDDCLGATLTEGAASLWPYKYVAWKLRHLLEHDKINLQTNTPVKRMEPLHHPLRQHQKARYRIHTDRGSVLARNVLLATNAYTSFLLPEMASLIVPVRETMTALCPPASLAGTRLRHSHGLEGTSGQRHPDSGEYLISRPYGKTANVRGEGHLMLGGARTTACKLPQFGESDDSIVDPAVVEYLRKLLPTTLNLWHNESDTTTEVDGLLDLERAWTGIWGQSRDGAPWVGRAPDMPTGLWICGAYSGHGMPNATLCARAVATMIMAENGGVESEDATCTQLVGSGDIPQSYLITKERLERAKRMPEAAELDKLGIPPFEWLAQRGWQ